MSKKKRTAILDFGVTEFSIYIECMKFAFMYNVHIFSICYDVTLIIKLGSEFALTHTHTATTKKNHRGMK
jgi:hypothetical protein